MKREKLTPEEVASLTEADAKNDATTMSLEEYVARWKHSKRLVFRIPRSLHRDLIEAAETEGVSLNQYMLRKLEEP